MLNAEFNQFRGLNPVKIMITGPPASGKSFYADMLAKYYNIPKVDVSDLLKEVWRIGRMEDVGEDEFMNEVKGKVDELRDAEIERLEEAYNAKKGDDDEDFDPEAVDRDALKIRIPDEFLYKLL